MNILSQFIILLVMLVNLTGCTFQVPKDGSDFGSYPTKYQDLVREYMSNRLKDPDSAKYRFSTPVKAYRNTGSLYGGDVIWQGYLVDFSVNAKNSYGGYVGFGEPYIALIRNDRVYDADFERMFISGALNRY